MKYGIVVDNIEIAIVSLSLLKTSYSSYVDIILLVH